jgi:hypothetical protein
MADHPRKPGYYKDRYEKHKEYYKLYHSQHRHEFYIKSLYKKYGITAEDYFKMLENQGGLCAVCRKPSTVKLCVDHDHETGEIRGLLCKTCNGYFGRINDSIAILENAILYLRGEIEYGKD